MVGLALDIGTREWKSDATIVAEAPVVASTFVERRLPTLEAEPEPKPTMQLAAPVVAAASAEGWSPTAESRVEPKPNVQLAALDPDAQFLDDSDRPASKGYIMYANSPTN